MTTIIPPGHDTEDLQRIQPFGPSAPLPERVSIDRDDASYKLLGESQYTSQTGPRQVSWVEDAEHTSEMFVQGLAEAYGLGISAAVAREFALDPSPARPISQRDVNAAIEAAVVGRQALAGVDFLTLLEYSATGLGVGFRTVATQLGIDTPQLSKQSRQQIDGAMRDRFAAAARAGEVPVSVELAQLWLKKELTLLTN